MSRLRSITALLATVMVVSIAASPTHWGLASQPPKEADDVADVPSQEIKIGGDERQRDFLIGPMKD